MSKSVSISFFVGMRITLKVVCMEIQYERILTIKNFITFLYISTFPKLTPT